MLSPQILRTSKLPLYEQLYQYIKGEIKNGNLKKEEALPSKRKLAEHLDLSVNTISKAYNILLDEGYIYSLERRGYFVSNIENLASLNIEVKPSEPLLKKERNYKYNFKINETDTGYFPKYTWKRIVSEVVNDSKWLELKDSQGLYSLRYDITNYLRQSRDVHTRPENIIISSGTEYLLQMLLYILAKDPIFAVENPGYKDLYQLFDANNISYIPIDVDSKGISYKSLAKSKANIVLITPSHQFPTGTIMPINRRLKLLNWANSSPDHYIIEDDYDSEFKYYGRPIPALKSLDKLDNVIYIGNFSKSISPHLRISYMVLPDELLASYHEKMPLLTCPVPNMDQLTLSKFMEGGYFERYLNKMRGLYDSKRNSIISILKNYKEFKIIDSKAGFHFILEVDTNKTEEDLVSLARINNIYIEGLSSYYSSRIKYKKPRIIIGFGAIESKQIETAIYKLIASWQ